LTTKHSFRKRKAKAQCLRICLDAEKLDNLIEIINNRKRFLGINLKKRIPYNINPQKKLEIWMENYQLELKRNHNYTNYNSSKNNHPVLSASSSLLTHEASLTVSQPEPQKNHAPQLELA